MSRASHGPGKSSGSATAGNPECSDSDTAMSETDNEYADDAVEGTGRVEAGDCTERDANEGLRTLSPTDALAMDTPSVLQPLTSVTVLPDSNQDNVDAQLDSEKEANEDLRTPQPTECPLPDAELLKERKNRLISRPGDERHLKLRQSATKLFKNSIELVDWLVLGVKCFKIANGEDGMALLAHEVVVAGLDGIICHSPACHNTSGDKITIKDVNGAAVEQQRLRKGTLRFQCKASINGGGKCDQILNVEQIINGIAHFIFMDVSARAEDETRIAGWCKVRFDNIVKAIQKEHPKWRFPVSKLPFDGVRTPAANRVASVIPLAPKTRKGVKATAPVKSILQRKENTQPEPADVSRREVEDLRRLLAESDKKRRDLQAMVYNLHKTLIDTQSRLESMECRVSTEEATYVDERVDSMEQTLTKAMEEIVERVVRLESHDPSISATDSCDEGRVQPAEMMRVTAAGEEVRTRVEKLETEISKRHGTSDSFSELQTRVLRLEAKASKAPRKTPGSPPRLYRNVVNEMAVSEPGLTKQQRVVSRTTAKAKHRTR